MSEECDAKAEHDDKNDENNEASLETSENTQESLECSNEETDSSNNLDDFGDAPPKNDDMECDSDASDAVSAAENTEEQEDVSDDAINDLLKLDATLDHDALNNLAQKIIAHFKENDSLEIDASALEDANTACIQAFVSINRYAVANEKSLKWLSPSDSFVESFNTLGLYSEMMQMEMA